MTLYYCKKYLKYIKDSGIEWELHEQFMGIKSYKKFKEEFNKIFSKTVQELIFCSDDDLLPTLINSDNIWLRNTCIFRMKNPIDNNVV